MTAALAHENAGGPRAHSGHVQATRAFFAVNDPDKFIEGQVGPQSDQDDLERKISACVVPDSNKAVKYADDSLAPATAPERVRGES